MFTPAAGQIGRLDPERYERRSQVKLSLLDLPYLPDEIRDLLSPVADRSMSARAEHDVLSLGGEDVESQPP